MLIGYARVSTKEQNLDLQLDALKKEGCEKFYTDTVSGAKAERPGLDKMLGELRPKDVVVVWKLDRLGRSLKHLVTLVEGFAQKEVGFRSLGDPIDTTTPHGRLTFNIFASLAQFEREIIRERTNAGLEAARARGRKGGRQPGLSKEAQDKARVAQSCYAEGMPVNTIAKNLGISKTTLYNYLRFRGVEIGKYEKRQDKEKRESAGEERSVPEAKKTTKVRLWLRVDNNNKYIRRKKKVRERIEQFYLADYGMKKLQGWEYELTFAYETDEDLEAQIYELLGEMSRCADDECCFIETDFCEVGSERYW